MSKRLLPITCSLILIGSAACSGDPEPAADAGATAQDASAETDAAATPDAAAPTDAGMETDAGLQMDAGIESDAGVATTGPIDAPDDTWTWVDFPDSRCMDGSPTGIGVNLHPGATKVLVLLMGGNACFNQASCFVTANLDGYGAAKFERDAAQLGGTGIYDRGAPQNIFKDYHFVYVPYCTGDVHGGANPNGNIAGSNYSFTGFTNLGLFLERLVPTFDDVTDVVLSGVSAGGFGAILNFEQFQTAFGDDVRVTVVDDSGPPMSTDYLAACLQDHFRTAWGFDEALLTNCAECLASVDGDFVEPYFDHLMGLYGDRVFTVLSSDGDEVIRGFWAYGQNDCRNLNDFIPPAYPASLFRQGLEDFRDNVADGHPNVGLFMRTNSARHVWLVPDALDSIEQDGVNLSDWLKMAIDNDEMWPGHVPAATP